MKRAVVLAMLAGGAIAAPAEPAPDDATWRFEVTLDGTAIGTHRFEITGSGRARRVTSRAEMTVRLLGIPVYRYRIEDDERWEGDCLRALRSATDDNGARRDADVRFDDACVMSFAYWNPRLPTQARLVDPQTGQLQPVRFEALPDAMIDTRGRPVLAHGWRLAAERQRITVWYAADSGRWIALDAEARGGRHLAYRLLPDRPDT